MAEDIPALAEIEAEADAMFDAMWAGAGLEASDWPAPTPGAERAARPGFLLAVGQPILGFAHVVDLAELGLEIEEYSHVFHMVSNISGQMSPRLDKYDAIRGGFPAGTMTGTPKVRAVELIEEIEDRVAST